MDLSFSQIVSGEYYLVSVSSGWNELVLPNFDRCSEDLFSRIYMNNKTLLIKTSKAIKLFANTNFNLPLITK